MKTIIKKISAAALIAALAVSCVAYDTSGTINPYGRGNYNNGYYYAPDNYYNSGGYYGDDGYYYRQNIQYYYSNGVPYYYGNNNKPVYLQKRTGNPNSFGQGDRNNNTNTNTGGFKGNTNSGNTGTNTGGFRNNTTSGNSNTNTGGFRNTTTPTPQTQTQTQPQPQKTGRGLFRSSKKNTGQTKVQQDNTNSQQNTTEGGFRSTETTGTNTGRRQ